jgi:uracil-DNA glycosylase
VVYDQIPDDWKSAIGDQPSAAALAAISEFVAARRAAGIVYPPEADVHAALHLTPLDQVRAVIVGQDPYHGPGQAHGLAFSVRPPSVPPVSLRNVFRELRSDLQGPDPMNGSLEPWARSGVLLLNTILTVDAGRPGSHRKAGWQELTDQLIRVVASQPQPIVFLLWGRKAEEKRALVDEARHIVLVAAHPSGYSAKGFLGTRPFSTANARLEAVGQPPIDWSLTQ